VCAVASLGSVVARRGGVFAVPLAGRRREYDVSYGILLAGMINTQTGGDVSGDPTPV
jgi:hypothetical protein